MAKTLNENLRERLTPGEMAAEPEVDAPYDLATGEILEPQYPRFGTGGTGEVYDAEMADPNAVDPVQGLTKLTLATVGGNPSIAKVEQRRVPVAVFFGNASGIKTVDDPTTNKTFIALTGAFNAINLQNNNQFMSGILYLPDAFQNMVVAILNDQERHRARHRDQMGAFRFSGVDFSFQIDAVPAKNPAGYSWVLKNLLPPSKSDPLALLRNRTLLMLGQQKLISGPPQKV